MQFLLTREEVEALVDQEYRSLLGRVVEVTRLSGAYDNKVYAFRCSGTKVKLNTSVYPHWMDRWCDAVYGVDIVEPGVMEDEFQELAPGTMPQRCWVYGTCRSIRGEEQPSDIMGLDTVL
ncbi:MAG: hypothetical protein WC551_08740 [Patescibacteria group bacterium]